MKTEIKIKRVTDDMGTYYYVTKKWWIFEWQISPSIWFYYKQAQDWVKNNYK